MKLVDLHSCDSDKWSDPLGLYGAIDLTDEQNIATEGSSLEPGNKEYSQIQLAQMVKDLNRLCRRLVKIKRKDLSKRLVEEYSYSELDASYVVSIVLSSIRSNHSHSGWL